MGCDFLASPDVLPTELRRNVCEIFCMRVEVVENLFSSSALLVLGSTPLFLLVPSDRLKTFLKGLGRICQNGIHWWATHRVSPSTSLLLRGTTRSRSFFSEFSAQIMLRNRCQDCSFRDFGGGSSGFRSLKVC